MPPETVPLLTREVFGNVSAASKGLFYLLALAALATAGWGLYRRARLWRLGRPAGPLPGARVLAANVWRLVLGQGRVRGRGAASVAHRLLFWGFVLLFVGTLLIAVEHVLASALGRDPRDPVFHYGAYFALYEVVLDTAGLAFLAGCGWFAVRRARPPRAVTHEPRDWVVLALFAAIGVSGYLLEGLRIVREQTPWPGLSYVGYVAASGFEWASLGPSDASRWHVALWWLHAALSLGLIAWFPYSRLLHSLAGTARLAAGVETLGALAPVSLDEVEQTGEIGVGRIEQFTRRQLLELDACVSCGRCEEACPAFEAGKPLSPRDVVQDLRKHLDAAAPALLRPPAGGVPEGPAVAGEVISAETIWSCTSCSACVDVCPLGVSPLGFLTDLRRRLIGDGQLRGAPASALQRLGRSGNPWGLPAADRLAWAADLDLPTTATNPGFEVLYWVGCAAAYDKRLQRVARSVVRLLRAAGVNFAVLGNQERCTGETARRMGDELLFQQLAEENVQTLDQSGVTQRRRRIIAHCPHCVNSLRQDYSQVGADLDVVHHTEFLAGLVRSGRLRVPSRGEAGGITYHDPCFLARAAGVTEAPRQLLAPRRRVSPKPEPGSFPESLPEAAQVSGLRRDSDARSAASNAARVSEKPGYGGLVEMPRHGRQTACCGAGGGRMWFDDAADTRIGRGRIDEALATGAATLAVACPFCLIMTSDGLAARGGAMQVRDVAEILCDALDEPALTG